MSLLGASLALAGTSGSPALAAPSTPPAGPSGASTAPSGTAPAPAATPPRTNATFGIQPVTNGHIDTRTAFTYQTGPGGAYQDAFAVTNYAQQPVTLQLYTADLTNNGDGGLVVGGATDARRGASAWIHLPGGLSSVTLPPASAKGPALTRIPFAWAVPTSAAAGDHSAAVVASLSVVGKGKDGNPVRLDQRVALRVFFRVSGTIDAHLSIVDLSVAYGGTADPLGSGNATVSYTLKNTGNVRLGAKQSLTSSAWLGAGGTPDAIADQPLLLPGSSVRVTTTVRHVFPGLRLTEKLHVDPVRATEDVNVSPVAAETSTATWAVPWSLLACVVALLLLVGLGGWWWARRRKRRPESRHGARRRGPGPQGGGGPGDGPEPTTPSSPALTAQGAR